MNIMYAGERETPCYFVPKFSLENYWYFYETKDRLGFSAKSSKHRFGDHGLSVITYSIRASAKIGRVWLRSRGTSNVVYSE